MPTWNFECEKCGYQATVSVPKCDIEAARPKHCRKPMEVVWSGTFGVSAFQSFDTTNIDPEGRSVHVGSRTDLSRLMNQHGLNHIDDPGLTMQGGRLVKRPKTGTKYFT